jgi:nitroimidazol reductase NimA-like FMN-containing flavoprotein (pyridoxamine 5'-phosphate oxidase superfamily)
MRRKDREITELEKIVEIMKKCDVCRLALFDKEYPYIVPLNFGLKYEDEKVELFFHGANEGRKLSLLEDNNKVGFEMDCAHKLITGDKACDYTMEYESVIGHGIVEILSEADKLSALDVIMKNYSKETKFEYNINYVKVVTVFKLSVTSVNGKQLKRK